MGKIITPGALGIVRGGQRHEFSIKWKGNGEIDLSFHGDVEVLVQMFYDVMSANEHVARTVVTSTLIFADQKKIALADLQKKLSYIPDGKIINPGEQKTGL